MTEDLRKVISTASSLVAEWPQWKQNILAQSSLPTVSVPRPVVNVATKQDGGKSSDK
jgi:hypothetical protein